MDSKCVWRVKKDFLILELNSVCSPVVEKQVSVGSSLALDLSVMDSMSLKPLCLSSLVPCDKGFDSLFRTFSESLVPWMEIPLIVFRIMMILIWAF